jgi:putative hydrolase of the HAD superfamily
MPAIRALFWDVGGVLLSNAWDHEERVLAIEHFHLDKAAFEARHTEVVAAFEEGKISLDDYLGRTVFYQLRTFSREDFQRFMFSLSKPKSQTLEFARSLSKRYLMGTLNNESRELNGYRIETFGLKKIFDLFVSSCFVGLRKPGEGIYRLALDLTQRPPEECCFLDDRPVNIEAAAKAGWQTVLVKNLEQLQEDLKKLGVEPPVLVRAD